ncbi:MAG TPA: aminotransferase class I/II-fold pyridoxal phosphate-dependent enzyme [Baekduia sp.]|uniref:pyridoxal phosphate-dependent aminotransferase n=1 Tax=Baekduia sp. TaxID=2600305 RepID=UPI002D767177|nr:aminotransferase class I/II-fold pyridoxal phosphate-dependent enzyme [Baekduia sp.]HET6510047.1 aminotransferase class I/II-fold pyridoxal phosphate-dependent enzyme [Baekduia sp.]
MAEQQRRRGLFGFYRQFEGLTEEEVNADLREAAAERRAKELSRPDPLDLSRTTWPEYPHPAIVNAITFAARRGLHRYLDRASGELRSELAHRHGVEETRVVVGDGAAALMSEATSALLEPGDELVTPWPSYPLYPVIARHARAAAVPVNGFSVDAVLSAVTDRTRLVALCNPNDPTGELLGVAELARLLEALPERVVVMLDEALRDFVDAEEVDATLALLDRFPRLLIFRTFSKAWGLAGLRCGYALGGPGAEPLLEQLAPELGVNELAQAGALEALRSRGDTPRHRAERIAEHRAGLLVALRERGFEVAPSQANVVWVLAPGRDGAAELSASLHRSGVIVQTGTAVGAPDRVRVTVPHLPEHVDRLLRALDVASG